MPAGKAVTLPGGAVVAPALRTTRVARRLAVAVAASLAAAAAYVAVVPKSCERFVVISQQRAGSTYLVAALDAHPDPTPDARDPDDLHNTTSTPGRAVRKQTSDVVSLVDAVVGGGGGGGGGDDASVPPLVPPSPLFMFMEDDFRTCEGALRGLRYLVQKTRTVYPEWLGLRTSYGLNGVVVRSEDLPGFRDYLLRHQARLPPDLLWTEWVEGTRADVRERTNARKLIVYRYNLFEHLGAVSTFSIRPRRPSWPGCYAPMSSAWSLTAVE